MTASYSGRPLLKGVRRLLRNQWFVALAILVIGMAVRWEFNLLNPHPTGFFIYHGSPISDGSTYTFKAISIAQGFGIPTEQQPAIRPFYSIVLACVYTWTGFSLVAVSVLNIIIEGATAALIYLCGALVFNRLCAFGAALFFAIDPTQLIQTPQAGSEPLGLLFFVGSVYAALLAFKNRRHAMFFLSGLLIGLSNLTRTLTVFTLPFYIGLILVLGWRDKALKTACLHALVMLLGFSSVMLPWLIRQEREYGIASLSDNIGEAIYAATSPAYQQWTPAVRKDADAAGIPNTIGDRYRYFIDRALENARTNPGFYLRNVGAALWEYANTFGPRSRATSPYGNVYSSAYLGQKVFLYYFVIFMMFVWLLRRDRPFAPSNFLFLLISIGLFVLYQALPPWATFVPILTGIIFVWEPGRRMPNLILSGTLVASLLGSAIFANPVLFRTVLMTDWLFVLYFLAGVWFPAETLSRRLAGEPEQDAAGSQEDEANSFQHALASASRWCCLVLVTVMLVFFLVSGTRLVALSVAQHTPTGKKHPSPGWFFRLKTPEKVSILQHLQRPPFAVLPEDAGQLSIYQDGKDPPKNGDYLVEIERYHYNYYITPGRTLPYRMLGPKSYARTLVRLSRFEFIFSGEIPDDFADRPLVFIGVVVPQEVDDKEQSMRPLVRGLAIIPVDSHGRPDFARAVCAPPVCDFTR